ncbi:ArsC family reductase [Asticcacaulis tiandongensis]|uniref:ArsC family reductase n=1 Tax=Asticcacaulis tiandongensis TaxID=2565365 RepID=UPI0011263730|nr:ArsC family reductase [Asticcacaulis tiandongensis]
MTITIYGIKNCDTMKKARVWLEAQGVGYQFHDYKVSGISRDKVVDWVKQAGLAVVLNKAGTTFRKLPEDIRNALDEAGAIDLMVVQPSMVKRPVLEVEDRLIVGFKPEIYQAVFK